ncbi:MAG: GNAT family N-acetyltransferase [Solirubrobacteraceae bacterium]
MTAPTASGRAWSHPLALTDHGYDGGERAARATPSHSPNSATPFIADRYTCRTRDHAGIGEHLHFTTDPGEFAAGCEPLLRERIECNVAATILMQVRAGVLPQSSPLSSPLFAYALDEAGTAVFAALRTPPRAMVACGRRPGQPQRLVDGWLERDRELPGVHAAPATARAIAAAWARRTGGATRCRTAMAMHALEAVDAPPRPASGALRVAGDGDLQRVAEWWRAFECEAHRIATPTTATSLVAARIGDGGAFLWEDGEPVSLVAAQRPVGGVVRIGPVYTPPAHRGRGYAGSAVAAVSRRALADGAQRCMLLTDLANPTSNKIYAEVGYRRISDWEEHAFTPA